jgi:glycopeptide antibiotics resistance protein
MIRALAFGAVAVLAAMPSAFAHRLDEYLQSTMIRLEPDRIQAQIYLTPGIAVFPAVLAGIDLDADGLISPAEQRAYAERMLRDLSLAIDGESLQLRLLSVDFAGTEELKQGRGAIEIDFVADVPRRGPERKLVFQNHHREAIAAYLVNCLIPRDPLIRINVQKRNYQQSLYELNYTQSAVLREPHALWSPSSEVGVGMAALLLLPPIAWMWRQRTRTGLLRRWCYKVAVGCVSYSPGRTLTIALKWFFVLVIVGALLYPFKFQNHGHWENIIWPPFSRLNSIADFAQNIVLFLPFGYFVLPRRADVGWKAIAMTTLAGAGLSFCGEFGQIFIHFRSPSSTDVVMNACGAFLGAYLALWQIRRFAKGGGGYSGLSE